MMKHDEEVMKKREFAKLVLGTSHFMKHKHNLLKSVLDMWVFSSLKRSFCTHVYFRARVWRW